MECLHLSMTGYVDLYGLGNERFMSPGGSIRYFMKSILDIEKLGV